MSMSTYFQGWVTSPPVLRTAFGVLRTVRPVAKFGKTVIVTRYNDILDVLKREEDFTVHEIDGYKMEVMGNPFVLGMDASPESARDRDMQRQVIKREDLGRIREMIRDIGNGLIEKARSKKSIDTVDEYARLAAVRIVTQYFGVPSDEPTMMRWQRDIFNEAFVNLKNDKAIHEKGMVAGKEITTYMNDLIRERKLHPTQDDNVLNRLLAKQKDNPWLDDNAVRRNIFVIMGVVENTSKVVTHVIDELLKHPDIFAKVKEAALNNDMETVHNYCFDALRFNPHNPVILRYCKNGSTIGDRKIAAGSTVYLATISAMFDPEVVRNPKTYDPTRKVDYLHFGHGPHLCAGRYISAVNIPELVAGLVKLPNLRRAEGKAGKIEYVDLVFPKSLTLKFE